MKSLLGLILIIMGMSLASCGDKNYITLVEAPDDTALFHGFFTLPNTGYVDSVIDNGGLYDLVQLRLVVTNNDGSLGVIPLTSLTNLPDYNSELFHAANMTYGAGNNVKNDSTNAVLTGSLFTAVSFTMIDDALNVHVQIYNGSSIVFDHEITEE